MWAPLTGAGAFVVDLSGAGPDGVELEAARQALRELPCLTIGLGPASRSASGLADRFDVLVADEGDLEAVLAGNRRSPLAALTLAQLLRLGEGLGIADALVAESLVYSTAQSGPEFGRWLADRRRGGARSSPPSGVPLDAPVIRVDRDGPCLRLALNRPEVRNAFSAAMRDALIEALRVAEYDPSVEEIRLEGAGTAFCSGGDLDEFGSFPDPATAHAVRSIAHPARVMAACAARVRVRLHGACVGAGIELPAFAREVVATPDAWFWLPEVGMGLVPGAGGTVSLPRRIGRQRTAWLAISGARLDATAAAVWGLVDRIETPGEPRECGIGTAVRADGRNRRG